MQKLAKNLSTGDRLPGGLVVFCVTTSSMDPNVLIHLKDDDRISSHKKFNKEDLVDVIN